MGQLRDRMEQDLILRKLSPATRRNYLLYCRKFAGHIPDFVEKRFFAAIQYCLANN